MKKEQDEEDVGFLQINPNTLDEEWLVQPPLYRRYAAKLTDAKYDLDQRKLDLKVCEARLDQEIRENPSAYNIKTSGKPPSETKIEMAMRLEPGWLQAVQQVNKAQRRVGRLQATVEALEQRKYALQDLVKLRLSDYYADPVQPAGAGEQINVARRAKAAQRTLKD